MIRGVVIEGADVGAIRVTHLLVRGMMEFADFGPSSEDDG